jgi:hypothetical protein
MKSKGMRMDYTASIPSINCRASGSTAGILPIDSVIVGDSTEAIRNFPSDCVHMILSDIPYGIGVED